MNKELFFFNWWSKYKLIHTNHIQALCKKLNGSINKKEISEFKFGNMQKIILCYIKKVKIYISYMTQNIY